ncbi:right-handed parallel beta-helix repeat-containing protein [Pseudomonas sp. SK3(2021)]|uniref:right-handed parallel beta-helix repeat-containing protein n=1 Tax=Pseudomonas sp. SK3(2021) TaxID=2841064 RepID=UPI00192C5E35|nr:right-handed parallel beta-helix repeat-containing protein [Pseudomonas sp. SK3(2021)]QQZ39394.1 right-handed parallel beta-helix repeat-containing protein [Pseudomonas sp. SK3(2021)]
MQGDFSVLNFDPHEHDRAVNPPADGVLRNLNGVLHQQGRVTTDADLSEGELLELGWHDQAGRDIIGAGVCAVPAAEPQGFRVESAALIDGAVRVMLRPGRAWADGILTRLAGEPPDPLAPVERLAAYFGPPLADPLPTPQQIADGTRDAVILEVSEEALHGFQYPQRLIEPALGGPDTSERAFVNFRLRLLRLAAGEDCRSSLAKLRDDPSSKGRLSASLAPVQAIVGDCPVVGGGGYTGFEHCLYRIEIADVPPATPARFKWSQWNGGLAGRGRFDSTSDPDRVIIDAGRTAIVNSGLTEFYLEALQYDALLGAWIVVYGTTATLNTDHDLELAAPASFGTLPATTDSVFLRLWNGIADITAFPDVANPVELRDGIRLAFDAPTAGNYRPGDYWTFKVRAGEIANPQVLVDNAPPTGIVYHRVPLAEIDWTAQSDTELGGSIEDCRKRFRPLTNQKICCTFLVGDGLSSFGDFNSLEEAAAHLPAAGGELCLLPGLHRANLRLEGRHNVKIHGCAWRTLVLPRTETRAQPILHFVDCIGIEVCDLDLLTYDGIAVRIDGSREGSCQNLRLHDNRMIARTNAVRASNAAELVIAGNRLHLLDTVDGRATISVLADDVLIERNTLLLLPFVDPTPDAPDEPDDDPTRDPADPCARPEILYLFPTLVQQYAFAAWTFLVAQLAPKQPYRALGGIHVRAGSERVRILENPIAGGAGNGITLGGDLDPADILPAPPTEPPRVSAVDNPAAGPVTVNVTSNGQFLALVQDEQGQPLSDVDLYLEAEEIATDRSDGQGMASVKVAPGAYRLDVSPHYRVLRITEARDEGVLVNTVTLAARDRTTVRGFLHEITIEANDISMMGLSGIGFAPRHGASLKGQTRAIPSNDPKAALLAYLDAALLNLALTPLLRATDPVRDLVILNNRLHHNLLNPFTEALLAEAQFIGRGGISLAIVESARVSGNHVYENGPRAADPACGVFVGYGDNLEITDNVLAANGATTADFEKNRNAGIRGGIYVRFAGAITTRLSTSSGRNAALRVHDNRIDQPAGRALSAFTFGPVSVANNHFNSEFSGLFGFLDTAVGGVLILNLGGIHRLLARRFGAYLVFEPGASAGKGRFAVVAEQALPGGETLFDDNYVRLGLVNRSITSQALLAIDDLGYASNTTAVYRSDPFFANAVLIADSLRATASRLREDVTRTISLLSMAVRMNMTALNQADHCIVAWPIAGANPLPTVDRPNQVLDAEVCSRIFAQPSGLWQFLASVLTANAEQLGGTLSQDSFTSAELATLTRQNMATAISHVNATQVAATKAYQVEAARMAFKRGAEHPTALALAAQGQAGARTNQILRASAETVTLSTPSAPVGGSTLSGRFINDRGQGLPEHLIELVKADGSHVERVARTDATGFFSAAYDESRTAALAKEGKLFARVLDLDGKELLLDKTALRFAPDAQLQATLVVPVRVVPRSVAVSGTLIYGTPPPAQPGRTSLEKLDLDEATRKQLKAASIADVEGILETDPNTLAKVVGSEELAQKLITMAKRLLGSTPPAPAPAGKSAHRRTPSNGT